MTIVSPPYASWGAGGAGDFAACRAVILEPSAANRRLLEGMLCTLNVADVTTCGAAPQAWRAMDAGAGNLLFLDWSKLTDAITILRQLRADGSPHRFLPVVVTSGFAGLPNVASARDVGATEYMLKPFTIEVVRSRLYSIVRMPRLFVQSGNFFGPDRRRRRAPYAEHERRTHENWCNADRRQDDLPWQGRERRQTKAGFGPPDRRTGSRS
jgi:two-component system, chemotaxis family, chemotaxis protein CheY